jgi:hypothetical protein
MVAILAVVCPRQILFWLSGVGAVRLPAEVLVWADGVIGAATAVVMTGGQMFLVHHLTTVVLTSELTVWRRLLLAALTATWVVVVVVTVVIGSAHVVMEIAGAPLLEILQVHWMIQNLPTWLVGLTAVAALELTAAGLALAHADALSRSIETRLRETEARRERALEERNAEADAKAALAARLKELEAELRKRRAEPAQAVAAVRIPCRFGCGWMSAALPEARARRAERAHVGHRHKEARG